MRLSSYSVGFELISNVYLGFLICIASIMTDYYGLDKRLILAGWRLLLLCKKFGTACSLMVLKNGTLFSVLIVFAMCCL